MKLHTLMTALLGLALAGLLAIPEQAEAKRFGGGGSVGRQYSVPHQSQPARQTQSPGQAQGPMAAQAPRSSGASRWLGPLAGLAAGGLLASLFLGDSFHGIQLMDILLIVALVVGGVMLFRMLKRGTGQARPAAAGAFGGAGRGSAPNAPFQRQATGMGGSSGQGLGAAGPGFAATQAPAWFEGAAFAEGAKGHFIRLQSAWDRGDFAEIREYTTPEMLAELQREHARLGGNHQTEVVRLNAELLSVQRDGDLVVASLQLSGLIREDRDGPAQEFREIWHVQHRWDRPDGDWLIAGIQQA